VGGNISNIRSVLRPEPPHTAPRTRGRIAPAPTGAAPNAPIMAPAAAPAHGTRRSWHQPQPSREPGASSSCSGSSASSPLSRTGGGRSVAGPFLVLLGASAVTVGVVAAGGELVGHALRLWSGRLADRTERYWAITFGICDQSACGVPARVRRHVAGRGGPVRPGADGQGAPYAPRATPCSRMP
jgi:hypothetical protein